MSEDMQRIETEPVAIQPHLHGKFMAVALVESGFHTNE